MSDTKLNDGPMEKIGYILGMPGGIGSHPAIFGKILIKNEDGCAYDLVVLVNSKYLRPAFSQGCDDMMIKGLFHGGCPQLMHLF